MGGWVVGGCVDGCVDGCVRVSGRAGEWVLLWVV